MGYKIHKIQAKGYGDAGASTTKRSLKGFAADSGSPSEDINWHNATLRQRGRMLYMSSPIATSAIKTNRTKAVGVGLQMKSTVKREILGLSQEASEAWQKKVEAEFKLWSSKKENCDALGINNFKGLQQLAIMSWLMSGDVFALVKRYEPTQNKPYTLRLHLIEADRVSTPTSYRSGSVLSLTEGVNPDNNNKVYDGVEVDKNGMIVAYHVCSAYPRQIRTDKPTWTRVEAYGEKTSLPNIMHVMHSERCEQYRGITYLAPVIEPLLQLRRYTEYELAAALVQSMFSAWIITESDKTEIPINEVGAGEVADIPTENPTGRREGISPDPSEYEMGAGTIAHLNLGEDIKFGNPNVPTSGFDQFVRTMCRLTGAALDLPHDVLVKEYNRSYSASRAALLDAWEGFKMIREWFVDDFCQPTYETWLAEAVALGRIKAPGFFSDPLLRDAWSEARWIGPVQGTLDPTKEVKAAIMNVDRAFKTHEQATFELGGGDWNDNVEQLTLENEKLKAAGGANYMATLENDNESQENVQEDG